MQCSFLFYRSISCSKLSYSQIQCVCGAQGAAWGSLWYRQYRDFSRSTLVLLYLSQWHWRFWRNNIRPLNHHCPSFYRVPFSWSSNPHPLHRHHLCACCCLQLLVTAKGQQVSLLSWMLCSLARMQTYHCQHINLNYLFNDFIYLFISIARSPWW